MSDLPSWNLPSRRLSLFQEAQNGLVGLRQTGRFSFSSDRQGNCLEWLAGWVVILAYNSIAGGAKDVVNSMGR